MKGIQTGLILLAIALVNTSCVVREVRVKPEVRGQEIDGQRMGLQHKSKTVEKKMIWFWQDEFKNP